MDKKKIWEGQNRIASEGLEWLYAEPHQKDENEEEAYLLGKPVNKIDEKKDRFDSIQAPRQELISRFREDPLFVIKKLEHDQKKLIEKYNAIKSKDYNKKHHKSKREHKHIESYDDKKHPKIPHKVNPLDYAFGVNDDIAPPEAIQATAREKSKNERKTGYYSKSYLSRNRSKSPDYNSKYEKLKEYGKDHLEKTRKRAKYAEEYDRDEEKHNFTGELKNKMYDKYIDKIHRERR